MMRSGGNDRACIFFLLTLPPLGSAFFYYSLLSAARSSTGIRQRGIHYREDGFRLKFQDKSGVSFCFEKVVLAVWGRGRKSQRWDSTKREAIEGE